MHRKFDCRLINLIIKIVSVLIILLSGIIGFVFFRASIKLLFILAVFMVFYVLFPGAYITRRLSLDQSFFSTTVVRSFFSGFALNIILYFIAILIGSNIILYTLGPIISAVYIYQYIREHNISVFRKGYFFLAHIPSSYFVFVACVFVYSMLSTQYSYISPKYSDYSLIKLDFGYHAGIINALALGFPPQDPWIDDLILQYHYFSEMLLSVPVRLFGLPSEELLLSGTPYIITPVLSTALYSFFKEFCKHKNRAGLYCLSLFFSNMFMLKGFAKSWFLYHIFSNINNAGLGLSALLVILPMLKIWDTKDLSSRGKRFNTSEIMFFAVMVMLTTGIKGPVAIVLIGALIGTMVLGLLLKAIDRRIVAVTLLSAFSFIFIYIYIIGAQGAQDSNETGGSLLNPWEVTDLFFLKDSIINNIPGPRVIGLLVVLIAFVAFFLTAFIVPFIAGYCRELYLVLTGKRDFVFSRVTVYACALVGFIGLMLLNFSGHSQVYFGFVTAILVPVISFWFFEDICMKNSGLTRTLNMIFIICMCISAATTILYMLESADAAHKYYVSHNDNRNEYRNISTEEYNAMLWLKNNTSPDVLIASDRYYSVPLDEYDYTKRNNNNHFAYAIYSCRRQYVEGSGFSLDTSGLEKRRAMIWKNKKMFDPDNKERGDLARSLGVDYIVVSKRFNPARDLSNNDYKMCYSNDDVDIYKITEAGD